MRIMDKPKLKRPSRISNCRKCLHYDPEFPGACPAFYPNPIPNKYLNTDAIHDKVENGQNADCVFWMREECLYPCDYVVVSKKKPSAISNCRKCFWYDSKQNGCPAFYPDSIPDKYLNTDAIHDKVDEGQRGDYVFVDENTPIPT